MDVRVLSDLSSQSSVTSNSWIPTLQVSGHAGTGKTQLMLQFALQMPQLKVVKFIISQVRRDIRFGC
jgi:predicted ATP-dependent serine protease